MSITTKKEKKQSKGVAGSGLTQKELTELKKKSPRRFKKLLDMLREGKTKQDDNLLLTPDMMKGQIGLMGDFSAKPKGNVTDRDMSLLRAKGGEVKKLKGGGLAEATAKLKAKGFSEGGTVIKTKTVAMDKSPNSGLITQRGFGASRRT